MTNRQQEMVRYLIEDENISMEQAMERFYMSGVFDKLNDIETGLYLEGSSYIYEMLKREKQYRISLANPSGWQETGFPC